VRQASLIVLPVDAAGRTQLGEVVDAPVNGSSISDAVAASAAGAAETMPMSARTTEATAVEAIVRAQRMKHSSQVRELCDCGTSANRREESSWVSVAAMRALCNQPSFLSLLRAQIATHLTNQFRNVPKG
jgi:hypothetical protein